MTHATVGRRNSSADRIDPARAAAMHATLGRQGNAPGMGDELPILWHWTQFWNPLPADRLGRDGHSQVGGIVPDTGLPRRMWAGGRLQFHRPLIIGQDSTKTSTLLSVTPKSGRSGPLSFVTVKHEVFRTQVLAVSEEQDLVFREDGGPDTEAPTSPQARGDETWCTGYEFDALTLFRYSALTFNSHRIHYDLDYCRDIEGYPGLVVHGPLLAQLLVQMAEERLEEVTSFSFRAVSPLFHFEKAEFCACEVDGWLELWVRAEGGRLVMTATTNADENPA